MKTLSSALILSENILVSAALCNTLREKGIQKIYEAGTDKTLLSNILNSKPEFIFVDLKNPDYTSLETVLQLDIFFDSQIAILTSIEYISEWKKETSVYKNISILSKPLSAKEIEGFIIKKNSEFFFGEAI